MQTGDSMQRVKLYSNTVALPTHFMI